MLKNFSNQNDAVADEPVSFCFCFIIQQAALNAVSCEYLLLAGNHNNKGFVQERCKS